MDYAGGLTGRHRDQFQHSAMLVRADYEEAVLAVVFILHEPDGVGPCVLDVGGVDPVPQGRAHNLHDVNSTLTSRHRQHLLDAHSCRVEDGYARPTLPQSGRSTDSEDLPYLGRLRRPDQRNTALLALMIQDKSQLLGKD